MSGNLSLTVRRFWHDLAELLEMIKIGHSVLALPFADWSWVAWGALVLTLIGRLLLADQVDRAFSLARSAPWWVVLRDLLSFGLFVASFLGREVAWRRHRFILRPDGALAHDGEARR